MKNKLKNDLNISIRNTNSNNTNYTIGEKLDANMFYENDYTLDDNNCLYVCFCDLIQTNHSLNILMKKFIKENLKNYYDKLNKNNKGTENDIEIFTYITGFNIIILNKDYEIINIYNNKFNDTKICVYAMINNLHIKALIPKNNKYYVDYKNYSEISNKISEKLLFMSNTSNILNEKISYNDFKNDENEIEEIEINDDMNKTVAGNINKRSNIKSRKVISHLDHQYAVKYGRKCCPITTVITKFKSIDDINNFKEIIKELNIEIISFENCLKKCKKERNEKYDIDEFLKIDDVINYTLYNDQEINTENIFDKYSLTMEFLRNVGPCIDLSCSGKATNGNNIYRVFNSMFELKDHFRRHHNKIINKYNILIIPKIKNKNFKLILCKNGNCEEHYLIEEKYLKNNDLILEYKEFIKNKELKIEKEDTDKKNNIKKRSKSQEKHTNKIINFLEDKIKEKNVEKDFIKNLEIKLNSRMDNIDEKIKIDFINNKNENNICEYKNMEKLLRNKNKCFIFNEKIKISELYTKLKYTKIFCRKIGPVICYDCSGKTKNGYNVYKIINSIEEFKLHCTNIHNKYIPINSICRFEIPNDYVIIERIKGECFLINKNILPKDCKIFGNNKIDKNKYLKIIGWNCCSACTPENKAFINAHLENLYNDIILLNECGSIKKKKIIKNKNYKLLNNNDNIAIIYKKDLSVYQILEKLCNDNILIARLDSDKNSYILINVYIPPNKKHEIIMNDFLNKLKMIKNRYKNCKLIIFGDLNINREGFKNKIENILGNEFNYHYNKNINSYTRTRLIKNEIIEKSYIDYFITSGFKNTKFDIIKPIGKSDHLSLQLLISKDETSNIIINKEIIFPFDKVEKDAEKITIKLIESLKNDKKVKSICDLIKNLKKTYKIRIKKYNKECRFINKINKFNENHKDNFNYFKKYIIHMSNIEYSSFIKTINESYLNNNKKEYFQKLRFYSNIDKNVDILKDLELINDNNEKYITFNKNIIDNKINEKYKIMLDDKGIKYQYYYENDFIKFYPDDILRAINKINPNKATSWDYIPNKIISVIKKLKNNDKMEVINNLTQFYNQLFNDNNTIPDKIITSRLFCLNKEASLPGNIDKIRPISIFGPLMKIGEKVLLEHLLNFITNNKILNKKQTGFIPKLGCEINLARLRQRVNEVLKLPSHEQKYLLFIDLKNAYDSVDHNVLFYKMRELGAPNKLINSIAKIYSFAKMKINDEILNVNRGVLQGSILSPMLFNIYINDLINNLDKNVFEILAYADDIAIICKNKNELLNSMEIIDKWALNNNIKINKNKSGIIILQHNNNKDKNINGYPLKNQYKYLGITLNYNIDPTNHLYNINKKLSEYLKRNHWLIKKYFSAKSLLEIANYYQISRLTYGMCIFIDEKNIMESLEKARMKYIRAIINSKDNVKSNLLRLVLCIPRLEYNLFNRLLNVVEKYEQHYNEKLTIFNTIIEAFNKRTGANKINNKGLRYNTIKYKNINNIALYENINISDKFMDLFNKYYFKYCDKRDNLIIKFFTNYGFFEPRLFPICKYCGENNSRTHIVNECKDKFFVNLREEFSPKIKKYLNKNIDNLEKGLLEIYFEPRDKAIIKGLKILKEYAAKLYMERPKPEEDA